MQQLLTRDRASVRENVGADERAARAQLRGQIGRLERQLGLLAVEAFPRLTIDCRIERSASAPRVLDLGELERVRDELADRISEARRALAARAEFEARNRELLEALLAAPEKHRGLEIGRADVGEPGCGGWRSAPRYGLLGMLMGWWRVKVSSGCPISGRLAAVEQQLEEEAERTAAAQGAAAGQAGREHRRGRGGAAG
ncbi:MAG TPA: hypothetical protein VEB65_06000 [Solirubrobacterales bacterium]|nr:hypothetical protein [Solirubrobacterales bacterium]